MVIGAVALLVIGPEKLPRAPDGRDPPGQGPALCRGREGGSQPLDRARRTEKNEGHGGERGARRGKLHQGWGERPGKTTVRRRRYSRYPDGAERAAGVSGGLSRVPASQEEKALKHAPASGYKARTASGPRRFPSRPALRCTFAKFNCCRSQPGIRAQPVRSGLCIPPRSCANRLLKP